MVSNSYAKYIEKFNIFYKTKIAEPILILEHDEKIVIDNLETIDSESYNFNIKNYTENNVNSIKFYYQFEFLGVDANTIYEFWNLSENKKIEVINNKTKYFSVPFNKKQIKYSLIVDVLNSDIKTNTNIKLKINTKFNNDE